ncbi:MAG: glutamate 5-kinase [Rikenellaceae bacterium]
MAVSKAKYKRVVVKIGSNVLTAADGGLDVERIAALTDQVARLYRAGVEVIMVSSGAVASGRSHITPRSKKLDSVAQRQLFSAVGQARLINLYYDLFGRYDIVCGQVLTTKESLSTRMHYLNQRNCMGVMLENGVVPILNENDTISVTELMFTDNDELSGMVAAMMGADALFILSNIDGIYNGNPKDEGAEVIRKVSGSVDDLSQYISTTKSQFGRGGMLTKCRIACKVADEGIEVVIANGKRDDVLCDLILEGRDIVCTRFEPSTKPISEVKKWIAHSDGFAKGELHINEGAYSALMQQAATSLLPVGVSRIVGDFEKDDIVKIFSPEGEYIGVGRVSADSVKAREVAGVKGLKALVHYDYLYIE